VKSAFTAHFPSGNDSVFMAAPWKMSQKSSSNELLTFSADAKQHVKAKAINFLSPKTGVMSQQ